MFILYMCLAILLFVIIFHTLQHYSRFGRTINKIPGLPPLPILGNILDICYPVDEVWQKVHYLFEKYYPTYRLWSIVQAAVFLRHPEDLKILLSCKTNIDKAEKVYDNLKLVDSDGILTSSGQLWQHHRRILNTAFTPNHLEIYTEKVNKRAIKLSAELRTRGDIFVENIAPMFLKFALEVVCDAIMDVDTDSLPALKEKEFRDAISEFQQISQSRAFQPWIYDFMLPFLPLGWRLKKVGKIMNSFRDEIIQARRKYHESTGYTFFDDSMDNKDESETADKVKEMKKNMAVADTLLLAEKKGLMDSHGIAQEVLTIIGAGYETTGMAISFLLTLLAENKKQQNLARAEILEILGEDKSITSKHSKNMVYLDRCVKESLRLFPTAPHIGRLIRKEIRLDKHTVPAGVPIYMSLIDLHRDHRFWPEPDKFDPDRFLQKNVEQRHPFAYLPFSAGLRNCIGQKLALAEIKLVTAHILYNFYLEPVDMIADLKPEMHFTVRCDHINVKFVRIDRE